MERTYPFTFSSSERHCEALIVRAHIRAHAQNLSTTSLAILPIRLTEWIGGIVCHVRNSSSAGRARLSRTLAQAAV